MKPYSKYCKLLALAAGVSLAVPASSRAAVVLTLQQVGSDVVLSMDAGGSINTNLLGPRTSTPSPAVGVVANIPSADYFFFGLGSGSDFDAFDFLPSAISGPSTLGSLFSLTYATSSTGAFFGIVVLGGAAGLLAVPTGYNYGDGDLLGAASSTFAGQTFASLGITPGTYVWTVGTNPNTDTITLNVGVPEHASLLVPAMAISALGVVQVRRRSRQA